MDASMIPLPDQEGGGSCIEDLPAYWDLDGPEEGAMCCEVSCDINPEDLKEDAFCLWEVLEECEEVPPKAAQKRRVEVSFKKLTPEDRARFQGAMAKEWQSWLENKVTMIVEAKGVDRARIIGSRWDQDPDLGRIATDSPTLRKESKHLILSLCASKGWVLWGADIKTAFLSGDASCRNVHFRPPPEVRELMQLEPDDLLRFEKAAYGLAEAPRAWFLRLSRELRRAGLEPSQLDPCVWYLRDPKRKELLGACGIHVDDLIGGGEPSMDACLVELRKTLPFGEFRLRSVKYTGAEIRQHPDGTVELTQEAYVDQMEFAAVPGKGSDPLEPRVMRAHCGQLSWVSSHSRPDQAFLASYLQGTQDRATCSHLHLYNKSLREMKAQKLTLRFPPVPTSEWRLLVTTDAGWCVRESGESQGGYLLFLCESKVLQGFQEVAQGGTILYCCRDLGSSERP